MTSRSLICEGACNPGLVALDAEVRKERMKYYGARDEGKVLRLPDDSLLSRLKALQHTDHLIRTEEVATCMTCQTMRRHGKVS